MKVRVGIDIACRAAHRAACADDTGRIIWSGHRFRTHAGDLEALWDRLPSDASEVMVVMEPTRNAWVPLAAWFRQRGAKVVVVPAEQSSDLRDYYSKYAKTDRLDAQLLARLPMLHPDGLHPEMTNGPADPLKRAVKIRSGLVHRRSTCMHRLDALLEILGPDWVASIGSDMTQTAFKFLASWANPHVVKRIGRARLARWFQRETRKSWGPVALTRSSPQRRPPWHCGAPTVSTSKPWPPISPSKPRLHLSSVARSRVSTIALRSLLRG
ncbi:MAG TPA: transposase [Acidimicrobiales bacterium]|jgi:transposase